MKVATDLDVILVSNELVSIQLLLHFSSAQLIALKYKYFRQNQNPESFLNIKSINIKCKFLFQYFRHRLKSVFTLFQREMVYPDGAQKELSQHNRIKKIKAAAVGAVHKLHTRLSRGKVRWGVGVK